MATLPTTGLGNRNAGLSDANTSLVGTEPVLELIASTDDADFVQMVNNQTVTAVAAFEINAMPGDFATMNTLSVRLRYAWTTTPNGLLTWDSLTAQVVTSAGASLSNAVTVASAITTTTKTNSSVINLTGLNTTADAATWDGAVILIRFATTRNMGGDATANPAVYAGELTGDYTQGAAPATPPYVSVTSASRVSAGDAAGPVAQPGFADYPAGADLSAAVSQVWVEPLEEDGATPVSTSMSARWAVAAPVADSVVARWQVVDEVSDTASARWDVHATVSDLQAARWAVAAQISDTASARWDVAGAVADSVVARWAVLAAAIDTVSARWAVLAAVADTTSSRWAVDAQTADTAAARWDVNGAVADSVAARWAVHTQVADSVAARWAVEDSSTAPAAFRAVTSDSVDAGTSYTVGKPAGTIAGDLLIVAFTHSQTGVTFSAPDGTWTQIGPADAGTASGHTLFWKPAGASEPSSWSFSSNTSGQCAWSAGALANPDPSTPLNDTDPVTVTGVTAISFSLTTTVADVLLYVVVGIDAASTTPRYSSAEMTERLDETLTNTFLAQAVYTELVSSATTYNRTINWSGSNSSIWGVGLAIAGGSAASSVSASVSARWAVDAPVADSVEARWDVHEAVADSVAARWAVGSTEPHFVPLGTTTVDGDGNYAAVQPGDTVVLEAGSRGQLVITNLQGTAADPITIVNEDSGVTTITGSGAGMYAGLYVRGASRHLRILGNGVTSQCGAPAWKAGAAQQAGIVVTNADRGVSLWADESVEHIEVAYVEIHTTTGNPGIHTSDVAIGTFPKQRGLHVHHCYIHDIAGSEGIYFGDSTWTTARTGTELDGVVVVDNLVTDTDRDGIQIGSAVWDDNVPGGYPRNTVAGNVVLNCGEAAASSPDHTKGIILNRGSARFDIVDNWIAEAGEESIYDQGLAGGLSTLGLGNEGEGTLIANNVVLRPAENTTESGDGIFVADGDGDTGYTAVIHNTVIHGTGTAGNGIQFNRAFGTRLVQNNISLGFTNNIANSGGAAVTTNRTTGTVDDARFVDAANDNYHLAPNSPCIGAGATVDEYVTVDFDGVPRPAGTGWDQGAYEAVLESALNFVTVTAASQATAAAAPPGFAAYPDAADLSAPVSQVWVEPLEEADATPVSTSVSARWNVAGPVSDSSSARWAVAATVTDSVTVAFAVNAQIADSVASRWAVDAALTAVSDSVAARWAVDWAGMFDPAIFDPSIFDTGAPSIVSTSVAARWDVGGTVTDAAAARWDVHATVSDTASSRWDVHAAIVDSAQTRWAVSGTITDSVSARWAVHAQIADTAAARFAVLQATSDAAAARWAVLQAAADTVAARWGVGGFVADTVQARWAVLVISAGVTILDATFPNRWVTASLTPDRLLGGELTRTHIDAAAKLTRTWVTPDASLASDRVTDDAALTQTFVFDQVTVAPDRVAGSTIAPRRVYTAVLYALEGDEGPLMAEPAQLALTVVAIGPYIRGSIPESLLIRCLGMRGDGTTTYGYPLFNQTPSFAVTGYIGQPGWETTPANIKTRVCTIPDPATVADDYPNEPLIVNGDDGWVEMPFANEDLDVAPTTTQGAGTYRIGLVADNGIVELASATLWRPDVFDGPQTPALVAS